MTDKDETGKPKKRGFFSKLFGRKDRDDTPDADEATVPHGRDDLADTLVENDDGARFRDPVEREVQTATVEEDSEAGRARFRHEEPEFGDDAPEADTLEDVVAPTSEAAPPEPAEAADELAEPEAAPPVDAAPPALDEAMPDDDTLVAEPRGIEPDAPEQDPEPELATEDPPEPAPKKKGFFARLTAGLSKSSSRLGGGVAAIFTKRKLDDETLEELEDLLIGADLGLPATTRITTALAKDKFDKEISDDEVKAVLASEVAKSLEPLEKRLEINTDHRPHIILMTGVNGAGKTTTIGKLAKKFTDEGKSVMLAAGDTFRAAAIEQLTVWGDRVGAPVVTREVGADAAGLAYDAVMEARAQNIDVLMIDTAGRLQNRRELMDELEKIVRVIRKTDDTAPHDSVLVLDATVGQNALSQAEAFTQSAGITGMVMTKLDGTARGGVLVALADKFAIPVHYIGVGESAEDLQPFQADAFTRALTGLHDFRSAQ